MSAIPQANTPNPHTNMLNVYMQIANKMEFQPKKKYMYYRKETPWPESAS
jgi:hypothetical protein